MASLAGCPVYGPGPQVCVRCGSGSPAPLKSGGLSVEQKLSGSHKALVEMQDVVAELLKTVPREYPASKVRGEPGPMGVGSPLPPAPPHAPAFLQGFW